MSEIPPLDSKQRKILLTALDRAAERIFRRLEVVEALAREQETPANCAKLGKAASLDPAVILDSIAKVHMEKIGHFSKRLTFVRKLRHDLARSQKPTRRMLLVAQTVIERAIVFEATILGTSGYWSQKNSPVPGRPTASQTEDRAWSLQNLHIYTTALTRVFDQTPYVRYRTPPFDEPL